VFSSAGGGGRFPLPNASPRSVFGLDEGRCLGRGANLVSLSFAIQRIERPMVEKDSSRRDLLRLAAIGAAVTAVSSKEAVAYQGNMERALDSLHAALDSLQQATSDKGGHRVHAMDLVRQAIFQTEAGIRFANEHGG
jgi:hypothetical protein